MAINLPALGCNLIRRFQMKETELAARVVEMLIAKDYEVFQEVQLKTYGQVADIIAVKDGSPLIIECKVGYGLRVLEQAAAWNAPYRAIAVPAPVNKRRKYRVAWSFYEVGVIQVGLSGNCKFIHHAPLYGSPASGDKIIESLSDWHKTHADAGSQNSHLTPYRIMLLKVQELLRNSSGLTLDEIVDEVGLGHYANRTSLKGVLRQTFNESDWVWRSRLKKNRSYRYYWSHV